MTDTTSRRALLGFGGAAALAALAMEATGAPSIAPVPAAIAAPGAPTRIPIGKQYPSFSAAAAAGIRLRVKSAVFDRCTAQSHLLRRATFGARAEDVASLKKLGIEQWLTAQLAPAKLADPEGAAAWKAFPLAGAPTKTVLATTKDYSWDAMLQTCYASLGMQVFSSRQIYEITVDIFANLLHVPIPGEQWATSPDFIAKVIRANAFGSYSNMLLAAMKHPAMLNYLNNDESRKKNVNENLGRELLELHTVGLPGKYTETDVRNSARILSGRTWEGWLEGRRATYGAYRFAAEDHHVGAVKVLGFSHANATAAGGEAVGDAYLKYLARTPATARKIARKIATRFVSDTPSDSLVERLAAVYLKHDTSILQVVKAVFLSSDFWAANGTRTRRPLEDAVGTARVLGVTRGTKTATALSHLFWSLEESGHTPFGWLPPNGYPDIASAWLGAGGMINRWNVHRNFMWWGYEFGRKAMHEIVPQTASMTADAWLREVSVKLVGVPMSTAHRTAILTGSDLRPGDLMKNHWWKSARAVALVLDSPYFQLR